MGFCEELEGLETTFPAQSRRLDTPKGRAQVTEQPGVHPHHARFNACGHAVSPFEVVGPNRGGKSVRRVVRKGERVLLRVKRLQRHHRSKDLLLIGATTRAKTFNHRGCHVKTLLHTFGMQLATSAQNLSSLVFGKLDVRQDFVHVDL